MGGQRAAAGGSGKSGVQPSGAATGGQQAPSTAALTGMCVAEKVSLDRRVRCVLGKEAIYQKAAARDELVLRRRRGSGSHRAPPAAAAAATGRRLAAVAAKRCSPDVALSLCFRKRCGAAGELRGPGAGPRPFWHLRVTEEALSQCSASLRR